MSISSIQSLIQKYGANFGIPPQASPAQSAGGALTSANTSPNTSGNTSTSGSSSASGSKAPDPEQAALPVKKTSATLPNGDTVSLSPEAMDYLAAHTGPLGKFEMPNMMDYFLNGGEESDASESSASGDPFSSLRDFL